MTDFLAVPMSPGEIIDRITILDLKTQRIKRQPAFANCSRELRMLKTVWAASEYWHLNIQRELDGLLLINAELWDVEDRLRAMENAGDFGADFIKAARSVYRLNDRRAALKHELNHRLGSILVEEKSHTVNGSAPN